MQTSPAAGWYPDPEGAPLDRYWDGATWTSHTRPARDWYEMEMLRQTATHRRAMNRRWRHSVIFIQVVIALVIITLIAKAVARTTS